MNKKVLFPLLLFIVWSQVKAQTWSAVGSGLSTNVIEVNYLYPDSNNYVLLCTSVQHAADTLPAWDGSSYLYPCSPRKIGEGWDIDTLIPDSIWYCVTNFFGGFDFGTYEGELYNWSYNGWSSHMQNPEAWGPPITANAVHNAHIWFVTSNQLFTIDYADFWLGAKANHVYCLMEYNHLLYVGGYDDGYPVVVMPSNADENTYPALPYSNTITDSGGAVYAMTFYNNQLFVGGDFPGRLAKWDVINSKWDTITGVTGTVYALQTYHGKLYIGGKCTSIYQYNDTVLTAVGNIPVGDSIKTMAAFKDTLYVGGHFANVNSIANTRNFAMFVTPVPPLCSGYVATITSLVNYPCGGEGNDITVAANGTPPYTYLWSPTGGTLDSINNVSVGTYSVTVTDSNGCIASTSVSVTQPPGLTAYFCSKKEPTCFGGSNGCATICANGGKLPYYYVWMPSGGTGQSACYLSAGTYTVNVYDSGFSCVVTASVTISQPPPITITTDSITNDHCHGDKSGSITVSASNGKAPYTYLWSDANSQTSATATGLSAGTYWVTVTDSNGCANDKSITVTQPAAMTISFGAIVNIHCNGGNNGQVKATPSGGKVPYTYLWSDINSQTTQTATGLTVGSYTLTVTDSNGCSVTAKTTITQPAPLFFSISPNNSILCNGSCTGSVTPTATGGTPPYTYYPPLSNLCAGTDTITLTDANGCSVTASTTITQPPAITLTIDFITNELCNGGSDGTVHITAMGGTGSYTYKWSDINGQTTQTATGLTTGSYTVTVHDANGCSATASATINQPPPLTDTVYPTMKILCNGGNNGKATVSVSIGVPPYTYLWSDINSQTTQTATDLSAGSYTVTVTDSNGCKGTGSITLTEPTAVKSHDTSTGNNICPGSCVYLDVVVSGGSSSYDYSWSVGDTTNIINVCPTSTTTYTSVVTDSNGCSSTDSIQIKVKSMPGLILSIEKDTACINWTKDSLMGMPIGGTYGGSGVTGANFNPSKAGSGAHVITYTYTDSSGCTYTDSLSVVVNLCTGVNEIDALNNGIQFYPNPFTQMLNVDISISGPATITVFDMLGENEGSYIMLRGHNTINTSKLPSGVYMLQIKTITDVLNKKLIKVN